MQDNLPVSSDISPGATAAQEVISEVAKAIVGKNNIITRALLAILARGHILIEDIPGVGKTTMAIAFSKALGLKYNRVQFTPDVLPSDITGFSVFDRDTKRMTFTPGAVICNLFLADELNRATSRTQSALLEAMEEGQVTVDGISHKLDQPFIVIATQNPVGAAGTQLLPDSQMDRFMVRLALGYPSPKDELFLLEQKKGKSMLEFVNTVLSSEDLERIRSDVDKIHIHTDIVDYIIKIISKTRNHPDILLGASPRASLALAAMAKANAYINERDFVIPGDVFYIVTETLAHRILLRPGAEDENISSTKIINSIVKSINPPKVK